MFVLFIIGALILVGVLVMSMNSMEADRVATRPPQGWAVNSATCGIVRGNAHPYAVELVNPKGDEKLYCTLVTESWAVTSADIAVIVGTNAKTTGDVHRIVDASLAHPTENVRLLHFSIPLTLNSDANPACLPTDAVVPYKVYMYGADANDRLTAIYGVLATACPDEKSAAADHFCANFSVSCAKGLGMGVLAADANGRVTLYGVASRTATRCGDSQRFVKLYAVRKWLIDTINRYG